MNTEALKKWRENIGENEEITEQKNPYQKWVEKDTRKSAIDAFCMSCMGTDDPNNPKHGYRTDIQKCTSKNCPLYNWRPYK